jgi:hypothetical protein
MTWVARQTAFTWVRKCARARVCVCGCVHVCACPSLCVYIINKCLCVCQYPYIYIFMRLIVLDGRVGVTSAALREEYEAGNA